ncbi:Lrp/AsnC family transcriptional regulator [Acidianus manzaensis]|uniref:AsnC family transcriptional regulator n=1 Tax=Acidianus manzaensis TaxID=282676 RepID=A0A1W6K332_9CREN|nr:Lrp/AsnC family transcriptional regulator [Acidianus manzaensis]ARM76943.1 AsnC family transcriptional regulator [Acidianus manzaensis]
MSWEEIFNKYLDEKDIKILKFLNNDANISDARIGKMIGLSKTSVRVRRLKLQNSGILKIVGVVILQNLGLPYADVMIKLNHDLVLREQYINKLISNDLVYEITEYMTEWDLLIRLFHKDTIKLKEEILKLINDKAVQDYKIYYVSRTYKAWGKSVLSNI